MNSVLHELRDLAAATAHAGINVAEIAERAGESETAVSRRIDSAWATLRMLAEVDSLAIPLFVQKAVAEGHRRRMGAAHTDDNRIAIDARKAAGISVQEVARITGEHRPSLYDKLATATALLTLLEWHGPAGCATSFALSALLRGIETRNARANKRAG